jgi:uncharacterized protein YndB with AHSA1/START domain
MLRRLFAVLLSLVIVLVLIGFMLPASVVIERDRSFDRPPELLFEVLSDLRHFTRWSPWLDGEDEGRFRLEGPASGVDATVVWREGSEAATSRMRITALEPPRRIDFDLEFGDNDAEGWFLIEPDGQSDSGAQRVRWGLAMQFGALDLVGRYVGLMLPGLIGGEYERGLEQLADYLERTPGRVPQLPADLEGEWLDRGQQ